MTTLENKFEEKKLHPVYPKQIKKTDDKEDKENVELNTSIIQASITKIRGVGPSMAEKLRTIGLDSIQKIARSTISQLTAIRGIGQAIAEKIKEGAKSLVPRKNLRSYPHSQHNSISHVSLEPGMEEGIPSNESEQNEALENIEEYDIIEDLPSSRIPQKTTPETPEIFYSSLTSTIDTPSTSIQRTPLIQQKPSEKLTSEERRELIHDITTQLQANGYSIMKTVPKLKKLYSMADLIALKVMSLNELLDQIVFFPIKVCDLKGELYISHETITYSPIDQNLTDATIFKTLLDSYFGHLEQCQTLIYQDFQGKGAMVSYLNRFHDLDISLKTSILKKNMTLTSGNLQFKLLVEPILVSTNKIGFLEKVIPFAYLKEANLHIIQITQLSSLVPFLEDKYRLLETHYKQDDSLISYQDAQYQLLRHSELVSVPFLGFGGVLLVLTLVQSANVVPYVLNIGYALLGIYLMSLLYFVMRFVRQKIELHETASTPYHKKKITLDNTSLVLINEKLSEDMMSQFVFETVGKHHVSKFLTKIEESGIAQRVQNTHLRSKIEKQSFLEQKQSQEKPTPKKEPKNKYKTRFSDFLED